MAKDIHATAKAGVDLRRRIAHFRDLEFSERGHLDAVIPGNEREIAAVIGGGVMEDASHAPAIVATDGFNVTYARVKPGHGNALHDHPTVEVFIPLSGRWKIAWGENGENEAILDEWDVISIPPGVNRSYRNVGEREACLLTILGGSDPGRVIWPQKVLDEAAHYGAVLNESGNRADTAEK